MATAKATRAATGPLPQYTSVPTPWMAVQLQRLLQQRGHAWLLQGPSGLGQLELGLALATSWLCDSPQASGKACGQCESCHAVAVRTHADLLVVMPETHMLAHEWPLPEKAQTELDEKKRKPSKEIRVEALRHVVEFAQRTSARGRGKVVLIHPAERMNVVSANTLLKTLEEPAGDVRFVLATEAGHQLLPTIRSRCIAHPMQWPTEAEAVAWLQACGLPVDQALVWLRMAGGRAADALALAQTGRDPKQWQALPQALRQGESGWLDGLPAAEAVASLQKLCHDVLASLVGGHTRYFDATALQGILNPKAPQQAPDFQAVLGWSKALLHAASHAEHPFHAGLMTDALVSEAKQALNSGRRLKPRL